MKINFNNKCYLLIFILTILPFIYSSCNKRNNNPITGTNDYDDATQIIRKKWTFLFYDDADFIHEDGPSYDPLEDFAYMVRSGQNINYLVLQDRNDDKAKIWYIDSSRTCILKKKMGEINMAGTNALKDFIEFAKEYYPADRYILSVYDHGGGCWGSCRDDTNGDESMKMIEMKTALQQSGGVDLILFSAPCLMGAIESVYEVRNWTDIYIGSENNSSYSYWKWTMRRISDSLNINPDIESIDLAKSIIENIYFFRSSAHPYESELTMSAIETSKIETVVQAFDEVAKTYLGYNSKFAPMLDSLYTGITFVKQRYMDVYDFAHQFSIHETNPKILQKLETLKIAFQDAIIAECHGTGWPNVHGLTVYTPYEYTLSGLAYYTSSEYNMGFVNDTKWDELLSQYGHAKVKRPISDLEKPPWDIKGNGLIYPFDESIPAN